VILGKNDSHLIIGGDSVIGEEFSLFWIDGNINFCATTRRGCRMNVNRPYVDLGVADWSSLNSACYRSVVFLAGPSGAAQCD
jgi:hypothetical protein